MDLAKLKKVYFIGLGGIGVSAVARILKSQGKEVSGSDAAESEITRELEDEGIAVAVPQQVGNVPSDAELVVYTVAATEENPERQRASELSLTQMSYPELLGLMMADKFGIGVSGTDGKTTTTAMLGQIFLAAGLDPTIVVGSKVPYLGGNARAGQSQYFIFEGDEYRRAFLNYCPRLAVVTNIKADHLDYYRDLEEIKTAFQDYLSLVPEDGLIVYNQDDGNCRQAVIGLKARKISFGLESPAAYTTRNIRVGEGRQIFDLYHQEEKLGEIELKLPARYNIYNALGAISAARETGIELAVVQKALLDFRGAWRRFDRLGFLNQTEIITDYAHTPYGVSQTIVAAKEFFPGRKILVVFQPHQYSRTKNLFAEFAASLAGADEAIVSDIFYVRGRENPDDFDVSAKLLAEAAREGGARVRYGGDLVATEKIIREAARGFDVVLLLGAGDIYELAKKLAKK